MNPVEIANAFYDEIDEASQEIEQGRCLPLPLAIKMAEAGLFRMLVPTSLGGLESHPWAYFQTLARVAAADGSAAWNLMIGTTTGLLSASLSPDWRQQIYGDPDVITVGVTAPIGRAEEVNGGLLVSGRWPFGSGSGMASWICGGCIRTHDGEPILNAQGVPEPILAFFPAADVTIHDTWDTSGLRGTGSNDIEVKDYFVPQDRWVVLGGPTREAGPLYKFPTFGLLALAVSAVSIGIAERCIMEFVALAGAKTPTGATRPMANRGAVQRDIATAVARVESAKALTARSINAAYEQALTGERLTKEHKAELRLAATNNAWCAVEAVDLLYHAAGGTAIYRKSKFQQCFRDVHVTTQHIMVGKPVYEVVGKVLLGLDPKQPL